MREWFRFFLLTAGLLAGFSARGDGLIIVDDDHLWPDHRPSPEWPERHPFTPLEVHYHHVNVRINGQIATTSVDQEFYNPSDRQLEGTYLFPIPAGAQIDRFTMEIGGKQVDAELLSASKARQIYEDIVRKMRDPALLEYVGRDAFRVRVYPIEPRSHKRITLSYSQVLKSDAGLVGYVYPLQTEKYSARPIESLSIHVEIQTPSPLKSVYSPSHAIDVKREGPERAVVSYAASDLKPETDFALYFTMEKQELGVHLLAQKAASEDGFFLLLASPGLDVPPSRVIDKDVVFVLDTSGSMAGRKLEQAKRALQFCVENLNDNDRFEVLRFSSDVEPLFRKLTTATRAQRDQAERFVRDWKAMGGTDIDGALKAALALRPDRSEARPFVVIFLTDGQPTIGTTDESQIVADLEKRDERQTRIFCFGIGSDVNTHLLDRITEATHAFSQYVLPEEDLEVKLSSFFSRVKEPILANPTLTIEGDVRATRWYPSPLPDLFKGDQWVIAGRYSGDGEATVTIEGAVNEEHKKFVYRVTFPRECSGSEFIPRLWATRRIGTLLDQIRLHGENAELRDEVTDLARQYGIVTPYTAYLIVDDEERRNVPVPMRSFQGMDQDKKVKEAALQSWNALNAEKAGDVAVAGAQLNYSLRSANAPLMPGTVGLDGPTRRSLGLATDSSSVATPESSVRQKWVEYSGQTRFVNGRNFFQNGGQWTDVQVRQHPDARVVRMAFGSSEYFDFVSRHPQAVPWISLGRNIQFMWEGVRYEIRE